MSVGELGTLRALATGRDVKNNVLRFYLYDTTSWRHTELNLSIYLIASPDDVNSHQEKMTKEWQGNANFTRLDCRRLLITDFNSQLKTESFSEFLRFLSARQ